MSCPWLKVVSIVLALLILVSVVEAGTVKGHAYSLGGASLSGTKVWVKVYLADANGNNGTELIGAYTNLGAFNVTFTAAIGDNVNVEFHKDGSTDKTVCKSLNGTLTHNLHPAVK